MNLNRDFKSNVMHEREEVIIILIPSGCGHGTADGHQPPRMQPEHPL